MKTFKSYYHFSHVWVNVLKKVANTSLMGFLNSIKVLKKKTLHDLQLNIYIYIYISMFGWKLRSRIIKQSTYFVSLWQQNFSLSRLTTNLLIDCKKLRIQLQKIYKFDWLIDFNGILVNIGLYPPKSLGNHVDCLYIYIYRERERVRKRETHTLTHRVRSNLLCFDLTGWSRRFWLKKEWTKLRFND